MATLMRGIIEHLRHLLQDLGNIAEEGQERTPGLEENVERCVAVYSELECSHLEGETCQIQEINRWYKT